MILVTGATGFIGSHVARLLAERGDDVTLGVQDGSPDAAIAALDGTTLEQVVDVARGISEDASVACVGPHEVNDFA